jgi:intracellular multiplication protein IcmD
MKEISKKLRPSRHILLTLGITALCYSIFAFAGTIGGGGAPAGSIGEVAGTITGSFEALGKLMMGIAYIAGFGFTIAAIFKFKQHKDNPTQIPIGTPIALLIIGVALIFLPGIIKIGGSTAGFTTPGGFTGEGIKDVGGK